MRKTIAGVLVAPLLLTGCASTAEQQDGTRADNIATIRSISDSRSLFEARYIEPVRSYYGNVRFSVAVVAGETCLKDSALDTRKEQGSSAVLISKLGQVTVTSADGSVTLEFTRQGQLLIPNETTSRILTEDNPCTQLPNSAIPVNIPYFQQSLAPITAEELQ